MDIQVPKSSGNGIPSLYALKALCVVFIVLLHTTLPGRDQLLALIRIGVPVFFMISGYFTYSATRAETQRRIAGSLKKIGWLIICTNAVYGLFYLLVHQFHPETELPLTSLKSWALLLFFGNGVAIPLWYLTAYFETLLLCWLFIRIGRGGAWLFTLIPALLAVSLATGMYGFLFGLEHLPYVAKVNFITVGMPCFLLGGAIRRYRDKITSAFTPAKTGATVIVLTLLTLGESALLRHFAPGTDLDYTNTIYLTTLPLAAAVFIWSLQHASAGKGFPGIVGKKYSRDIYLYHYLFFLLFFTFLRTPFIERYSFLVILPCSLLLAVELDKIRNCRLYRSLVPHK